jgi:hypothetical protein
MLVDPLSSAKSPAPHTKKKSPTKRRSLAPSAPEVKLSYKPAGRETLAAIDQELAAALPEPAEAPVIEISETPIGRETLAAIAEELSAPPRARQDTLPYADQIKNAPGARSPSRAPAPPTPVPQTPIAAPASAPASLALEAPDEVTIRLPAPPVDAQSTTIEIFELLTFIVRGTNVGDLSTDAARRKFVQGHLLRRVPTGSMDAVERVEVTPWTAKGTMVVRIWCRA